MNEAELGFELKNALARIEALEAALRKAIEALQWHDAVPDAIKANAVLEQNK
jgi:hypothetical protein